MYTRKELQIMYNCCDKVIRHWLRSAGITHRSLITPLEFELLKKTIGEPAKH
jgi:urease accessory protein UreE